MNLSLRVFTLEVNSTSNSITPHVRYISPDNVLKDLYRILNCEIVTCTGIEINDRHFDVWSDDEALLKNNPVPNLYIDDDLIIFGSLAFAKADNDGRLVGLSRAEVHLLWDFAFKQFPKLLDFIARQKRR